MISIGGSTEVGTAAAPAADHCRRCRERCASGKVAGTLLRPRSTAHCIKQSFWTDLPSLVVVGAVFPLVDLAMAMTGGCFPICLPPFVRLSQVGWGILYFIVYIRVLCRRCGG